MVGERMNISVTKKGISLLVKGLQALKVDWDSPEKIFLLETLLEAQLSFEEKEIYDDSEQEI